jgi:branched-chain amino acid transport system permease protein
MTLTVDRAAKRKQSLVLFGVTVGALLILVVLSGLRVIDMYIQSIIMTMGVNIIYAVSLNVINGYLGDFSCGHAGFMAVGAYTSSVLSLILFAENKFLGAPLLPPESALVLFPVVILAGGIFSALAGLIVAIPSFKTRDDYLAVITIAANYIIMSAINNMDIVGGSIGMLGMKGVMSMMNRTIPLPWMLIWIIIFVLIAVFAVRNLFSSVLGKGISAIRYDEISAEIMSVNTNKMKLVAFMFSSGLAGIAGALYSHQLGFINPGAFGLMKSTEGLVMVYLGGMGSLSGSVLAAVLFTSLLEILRPLQVFMWVVIPFLLILLMQFRPEGLMGNRELPEVWGNLKKNQKLQYLLNRVRKGGTRG